MIREEAHDAHDDLLIVKEVFSVKTPGYRCTGIYSFEIKLYQI